MFVLLNTVYYLKSKFWTKLFQNKIFECKIVNIFLPISINICFRCSKEPSHLDGSFEYPQHMFWLRNKKNNFWYALLTKGLQNSIPSFENSGIKASSQLIKVLSFYPPTESILITIDWKSGVHIESTTHKIMYVTYHNDEFQ